ncbi:MAG TPA: type VI secretion system baseplate subunit TssE [Phycisphaerae bacterium]|nr:type VI secretion system baseplate subunit TssE [Phycisphaerae bacterium]
MAELNPRDRLQPFLFDRLIDDQPGQTKESRDKNVLSPTQLRGSIMRDIAWLFNTPAPVDRDGIEEFPEAASSVINYGVPDLTGMTGSSVRSGDLERGFLKALNIFEARLSKRGLLVEVQENAEGMNAISLRISGEVIATQSAERMYIKTEIDLETGQINVKETSDG